MKILIYPAAILFIIAIGSILKQRQKNSDAMLGASVFGQLSMYLIPIASFVLLILCITKITTLRWFWNIPIAFLVHTVSWEFLTDFYSSVFGIKTKPQISIFQGGMVKHNLHFVDALVTFGLGLVFFIITR